MSGYPIYGKNKITGQNLTRQSVQMYSAVVAMLSSFNIVMIHIDENVFHTKFLEKHTYLTTLTI